MPNGVAAMERGDIDCYLRTVGEYQGLGRRKDTQGIIIGTIDLSTGGDGWAADQSIKSVCDLKGKTIAVEPNLPARLIMQMALKKHCGLSIKDTNLTDIAAADAIGVFADPNVAAVGTYEPVLSQVVAAHADRGAHIVASSKDYDDLILDVIFVHNDELEGQSGQIRQVPARDLPRGRLLLRQPGGGDPDHRRRSSRSLRTTSRRPCPTSATRPSTEAIELIGTTDKEGRVYEVFREAMDLNLEFGSSDVKLLPEDHIDRSVINQVALSQHGENLCRGCRGRSDATTGRRRGASRAVARSVRVRSAGRSPASSSGSGPAPSASCCWPGPR